MHKSRHETFTAPACLNFIVANSADFVAVAAPAALAFCICSFCMKHSDMRYIFGNFIVASLAFKLFAHARFFFGFRVIS